MTAFDDILKRTGQNWQWQIPSYFNIAQACVDYHTENGKALHPAIIVEDDQLGTSLLSYGQLSTLSSKFANILASLKLVRQERVLIRLPNSTAYPISFFGCLKYGAIAVPTSTLLSASEVAYLAKDSSATLLVTAKHMWPELKQQLTKTPVQHVLLAGAGEIPKTEGESKIQVYDLEQMLEQHQAYEENINSQSDDPAYLVYTSGTTGYPKGVLHAHRALLGRIPASRFWFDFQENDRIMHSGKFNWTYVLGSALMDPLFQGQTVIVHEGQNDAHTWPKLIAKHECSIFIGVPTIYRQIIQKTDFDKTQVPSLRHCMSAGEHLSDEMLSAWRERFGMDVYEAIGMSELSYYISQYKDKAIKPGAAGFPQPGHEVHLLDDDLNDVATGEEGMICIPDSDPGLFIRYWGLEEETRKAKNGGWFFTGDYARRDEEGYIWFLGRKDDIINSFGYRISPHEIERVIKTHPSVADCVALGEEIAKDKVLVSICVILHQGEIIKEEEILDFGKQRLAKYKTPKRIHFMQNFPRTKNGKVLRNQLSGMLAS